MAEQGWFYASGGVQQGPVSADQLRQMLASGQVLAADLVWQQGMANWVSAQQVRELTGTAAPPPLPPQTVNYAQPPRPGEYRDPGQDPALRMLIPVGRSGWAIAAGYLGLLSIIPPFGLLALIISIVAILDLKKHPELHGYGRAIFGIVMGSLTTVIFIVGFVVMVVVK